MHISESKIEVRYSETDMMAVVYHSNYLVWMEVARTDFVKSLGLDYVEMEQAGIVSPVLDIQASYKKPAVYGDTITVRVYIEHYDGLRTRYHYEMTKPNGEISFVGTSTHTLVKRDNFMPVAMRKAFPRWHDIYEQNKFSE